MCNIPKGISDFKQIRREGLIYIDKTKYIELLESTNNIAVHYLRPKRVGKTLFVSMLDAYYDIDAAYEYEELFRGTYIYEHPTEEKNSYGILTFDFSDFNIQPAQILEKEFAVKVYDSCNAFLNRYHIALELEKRSAAGIVSQLLSMIEFKPLYVIVEESDVIHDFAVRNDDIRNFYEVLKAGTTDSTIQKVFITGVSPLAFDSMISGFGISTNLSFDPRFHEMMGFTKEEMKSLISVVKGFDNDDKVLMEMKKLCGGYMFSEDGRHHVFHPDMSFFYLDDVQTFHKSPAEIIDSNIYSDDKIIEKLLSMIPDNLQVWMDIVSKKKIKACLTKLFDTKKQLSRDDVISLLYYFGYLTIDGKEYDEMVLTVPNQVIEKVFNDLALLITEKKMLLPIE